MIKQIKLWVFHPLIATVIFLVSLFILVHFSKDAQAKLRMVDVGWTWDKYQSTDVDPSTTASSDSFPIDRYAAGNVQVIWADHTNTSTFELQVTSDGTNWDTISGSSTVTSGVSGSATLDLTSLPGSLLRVTITGTNGDADATLTPYFIGKGKR